MAKKTDTKKKNEKSFEATLWDTANSLRGTVEPSEYKHVVLGLIFLKYAGCRFNKQRFSITEQYGEAFADIQFAYGKDNVFYLPENCRWEYIMERAKQDDIALIVDKALADIERENPALVGALPSNYYSTLGMNPADFASLLDIINGIDSNIADDKDFIAFSDDDIRRAAERYHQWQRTDVGEYHDEAEFCRSVKVGDLKDSSLVPSKYIEFASRDETEDYGEKMTALQAELRSLFAEEAEARREVENVFKSLGCEI